MRLQKLFLLSTPALLSAALLISGCRSDGAGAKTGEAAKSPTEIASLKTDLAPSLEASHAPEAAELPPPGPEVPDFSLSALDGKPFTLSSERGKHPVLINFFATWCEGCNLEYPQLQKLYEKYKGQGLQIVSISTESPKVLIPFVKQKGATFTILSDPTGQVTQTYQVDSIPASVLVDRNGKGVSSIVGYSEDGFERQISRYIPAVLKAEVASR
jgi:peroxiredoxin